MNRRTPLILVADDDADARLVMDAALRKAGYEVRLATGGHDALAQFRSDTPDLVMLDVEMPGMGGFPGMGGGFPGMPNMFGGADPESLTKMKTLSAAEKNAKKAARKREKDARKKGRR